MECEKEKALTVAELHEILSILIKQGEGHRIVLVPNALDRDLDADYRTIGQVDFESDIQKEYIYFEHNSVEFENEYFKEG